MSRFLFLSEVLEDDWRVIERYPFAGSLLFIWEMRGRISSTKKVIDELRLFFRGVFSNDCSEQINSIILYEVNA